MQKPKTKVSDIIGVLRKLLLYSKGYKGVFWGVLSLSTLLSALAVARPYLLKITVDKYILTKDYNNLMLFSAYMIGVLVTQVVVSFLFSYYTSWFGQSIIRNIRILLFQKMMRFKMSYYNKSSVGVLVTRTVNDMERIAEIFSNGFFEILSDILQMLVFVALMAYINWKLSMIIFIILPIIIYATRLFQRAMNQAFIEVRREVANLNGFVQERLTGMKIVQIFGREEIEFQRFKGINECHKRAWMKTVWYNSIFFPLAELASSITIGFMVWYGGLFMIADGSKMEVGTIFMFIQLSQMLFRPLRQIADKFNVLQMGIVSVNRVFEVLESTNKETSMGRSIAAHIKGDILFEDVRFSYVKKEEVLKGVSFSIKAGERVAIVGATGAGKSTIANLVNRFYDVSHGSIKVDGVDIKDYTIESLRSHISIVLQDVFLFADSIMNNITLRNPNIHEEDVIKASKEVGIYDFIMQLPGDFRYNVKERGGGLSSGQKQLIAFLRAYVRNPTILVLDEATSSIDDESEKLIQRATDKITGNRTSIIIAHRLATIKKASKIMVMHKGKVVEEGTHEALLNKDGYYKKLYNAQFEQEINTEEVNV